MTTENLRNILHDMIGIHETLATLAREKTEIIKNGQTSALQVIINKEEAAVKMLQQKEREREQAVQAWATQNNKGTISVDFTMSRLIKEVSNEEAKRLQDLQHKLSEAIVDLHQANALNQQLLQQSLQWVNMNLNMLQPQAQQATYSNPKKGKTNTHLTSRIDSKA